MLDWEPPEIEEPSDDDSGGVSAPDEADVHVLDRDRPAGVGLLKNEFSRTIKMQHQQMQQTRSNLTLTRVQEVFALRSERTLLQALPLQKALTRLNHALATELERGRRRNRGLGNKSRYLGWRFFSRGLDHVKLELATRKGLLLALHADTRRSVDQGADRPPADMTAAEHLRDQGQHKSTYQWN